MKLTKNTNRVRIESSRFFEPEIYVKCENGIWTWLARGGKWTQQEFQRKLNHDDKQGYQIFDISIDEVQP